MKAVDERGSVTVFVTIFTVALIFMAGLVVDGGQILAARRAAANVAESAARAGAQALDESRARRDGAAVLDQQLAQSRAHDFLAASGYQGTVSTSPDSVTVRVTATQSLLILGVGGLASVTVSGSGSATPLRGITEASP